MSKSVIYTSNTSNQVLSVGSLINLGSVQRRYGQNITLQGDSIQINGAGYYDINAVVTITSTTAGTVGVSILKDNVALPGASSNVSVEVGDIVTIPIQALVREYGCCCDNSSNLTFVLTGAAETVSGVTVIIEKL